MLAMTRCLIDCCKTPPAPSQQHLCPFADPNAVQHPPPASYDPTNQMDRQVADIYRAAAEVRGIMRHDQRLCVQENRLRVEMADLRLELEAMTRLVEENKEQEAALDDLLKHKQELLQERDNQVGPAWTRTPVRTNGNESVLSQPGPPVSRWPRSWPCAKKLISCGSS